MNLRIENDIKELNVHLNMLMSRGYDRIETVAIDKDKVHFKVPNQLELKLDEDGTIMLGSNPLCGVGYGKENYASILSAFRSGRYEITYGLNGLPSMTFK